MGLTISEYSNRLKSLDVGNVGSSSINDILNSALSLDYDLTNLYYVHNIGLGTHIPDLWSKLRSEGGGGALGGLGGLASKAVSGVMGALKGGKGGDDGSSTLLNNLTKSTERAKCSFTGMSSNVWEYYSPLLVENVSLGSLNYSANRQWIGNQWSLASGRPEISMVSITFRDIGAGALYEIFRDYYVWAHKQYPDSVQCKLIISKASTNAMMREGSTDTRQIYPIVATTQAYLESVTLPNLNSGSKAISTFTCNFSYDPTTI